MYLVMSDTSDKHIWYLAARKSKLYMVIYCPRLQIGKLFHQPEGFLENRELAEAFISKFVDDYYDSRSKVELEPMSDFKRYLDYAKIHFTYEVEP